MRNSQTPPPSRAAAAGLLQQCRDSFAAHVADGVGRLRSQLLDGAAIGDTAAPQLALRVDLVARWGDGEEALRGALVDFCDEQLRFAESSRIGQGFDFTASTLKLIDDSELELAIALDEARGRLREACEAELYKLDARLAWLMDMPALDEERHPLGPAAVVYGLRMMLDRIGAPPPARRWLLRFLERGLRAALPSIYGRLNAFLLDNEVLPRIPPAIRRRDDATAAPPRNDAAAAAPRDGLSRLRQQIAVAPGSAFAELAGGAAGGVMFSAAALHALDAVLHSLTQLQWRAGAEAAAPVQCAAALPDAAANLRQMIRAGGLAPELARIDPATVEVVSRLFDAVFADPLVPEPVAALLGWLQIPILKVALADPSFFNDAGHGARRVLDTMGRIALCLPPGGEQDSHAFQAMRSVATRIRDQFDRDPALFAQMQSELDSYAAGADLPGGPSVSVASRLATEYGQRLAAEAAAARVMDAVLRPGLPAVVADFLDGEWRECLVRIHGLHGEAHAEWQACCAAAADLAWSVEPKIGAENRQRLVTVLPDLLRRLNAGLDLIGTPKAAREAFLDALVALHSAAMKAGLPGAAAAIATARAERAGGAGPAVLDFPASTLAPTPAPSGAAARLHWIVVAADGYEVLFGHLAPLRPDSAAGADARPGDSIELRLPELAPQRFYLAWYHRQPRVLVFAGVVERRLLVLAPAAFEWLLQRRQIDFVAREPLLERAVRRALESAGVPG